MATYYLDVNHGSASDSNAGTSESLPWETIAAVVANTFSAGDNIYFKAGTYLISGAAPAIADSNGVGTDGNPILFAAYPGHEGQVIITRSSTPSTYATRDGINFRADYWHIRGIHFKRMIWTNGGQSGMEFSYNDFDGDDYPSMPNDSTGTGSLRAGLLCEYNGLVGAHIHHNIFRNWRTESVQVFNTNGLLIYSAPQIASGNYLIEDNWFASTNRNAFYEKEGALNNIWRRNLIQASMRGNNQTSSGIGNRDAIYDFCHNVIQGPWFNIMHLTDGARYYNNYFTTGKIWTQSSTTTLDNLEIYSNVVVPASSSHQFWQSQFGSYKMGLFAYFDDNVYGTATPQYMFDGVSQPLSYMTSRGHELSIATGVALSSVYDASWVLKSPYTTAGRGGGPVGPVDGSGNSIVALILDTSRYGPSAFDPGAPSNQQPTANLVITNINNLTVDTDNTGSIDPDGTIASRSTNWGDGTAPGTTTTPSHTYAEAGIYNITLTVTDNEGATGQDTEQVSVGSAESRPSLGYIRPSSRRRMVRI